MTSSFNADVLNSIQFWTSFFVKYEQYSVCLKALQNDLVAQSASSLSVAASSSTGRSTDQAEDTNHDKYDPWNDTNENNSSFDQNSVLSVKSDTESCSESSTSSSSAMANSSHASTTFRDRQKNFNKYVKRRFMEEFGPIEHLSYKLIKRNESSLMNKIKNDARQRFLPEDITDEEFKIFWKSALNTIRQTRYRYRSRIKRGFMF